MDCGWIPSLCPSLGRWLNPKYPKILRVFKAPLRSFLNRQRKALHHGMCASRMLATRLSSRRPSPTTALYTVTNAPHRGTPISKFLDATKLSIKAIAAFICVASIYILIRAELGLLNESSIIYHARQRVSLNAFSGHINDWTLVVVLSVVLWMLSRRSTYEESLLLIRGLGLQISSSSGSYLSTTSTRFIPTSKVQDIFIHEAFVGFQVKFYLAVIVDGEKEAVVVFPKLMPRREILEEVWRGSKSVLYQKRSKQDLPQEP